MSNSHDIGVALVARRQDEKLPAEEDGQLNSQIQIRMTLSVVNLSLLLPTAPELEI
jgi:hypothetical protein